MRFVLSLITRDNDYQLAQAAAAEAVAHRLGVDLSIVYANNDGINQSQQLLSAIQGDRKLRPDGILFEPAGSSALPHVAQAAVNAGIAWVILNRDVEYLAELRRKATVPCFCVTSDHFEIGRIQNQQVHALLPSGGLVLYIQGPSSSSAATLRAKGMLASKPLETRFIARSCPDWTQASGHKTISGWLGMLGSHSEPVALVAAQNDALAMGARKAFSELPPAERSRWMGLPFLGVDGLEKTGIAWVREGALRATVVVPPNSAPALELLAKALLRHAPAAETTLVTPSSYPALTALEQRPRSSAAGTSAY